MNTIGTNSFASVESVTVIYTRVAAVSELLANAWNEVLIQKVIITLLIFWCTALSLWCAYLTIERAKKNNDYTRHT